MCDAVTARCSVVVVAPDHFNGKEWDAESGNDSLSNLFSPAQASRPHLRFLCSRVRYRIRSIEKRKNVSFLALAAPEQGFRILTHHILG